jgi:hypothetical protein
LIYICDDVRRAFKNMIFELYALLQISLHTHPLYVWPTWDARGEGPNVRHPTIPLTQARRHVSCGQIAIYASTFYFTITPVLLESCGMVG